MVFKFTCRSHCNLQKAAEFPIAPSTTPFGNVGWDRSAGTSNLSSQAELLLPREVFGYPVNFQSEYMALFPNQQLFKVFQGLVLPKLLMADR